jgi:glycosyltransferase involved in cell wall biosynthesis
VRKLRVATVITRMAAGAGGVALRGALALDPDAYEQTIITGGASMTGETGGSDSAVLTGPDAVKDAPAGDLLAEAYAAGLEVARVPALVPQIAPVRDRAALHTLTDFLAAGRYDVVHTHSAKAGALGRLAAHRAGVGRIVHTYHGFPFHEFQPRWRRTLYVRIERRLSRYTDAYLAVGTAVAAEAIRRGLAGPDRIRTIPPAVDTISYPPGNAARGQARRRLGLPPGIRLVGTVGRVDYQKAPELWVDGLAAAAAGGDAWGLWIGDGPQRQKLLGRVHKRGLEDRFVWLGHRDDVAELLPAFDVFALASRYEGLPCVLVEAMAAGVPVVATAVNAVPDLVVPGETGLLVPPARPDLFGTAVRHLLDEPADARRMADAARARLGDRFTPEALATTLDQTYRR